MRRNKPDYNRTRALGKAVREAQHADDQLVELVAYCAHLTRGLPDDGARFAGISFRFYADDLTLLNPHVTPSHVAETRVVSLIFTDRRPPGTHTDRPGEQVRTHSLLFYPINASVVRRLENFTAGLEKLFQSGERKSAPTRILLKAKERRVPQPTPPRRPEPKSKSEPSLWEPRPKPSPTRELKSIDHGTFMLLPNDTDVPLDMLAPLEGHTTLRVFRDGEEIPLKDWPNLGSDLRFLDDEPRKIVPLLETTD